VINVVLFRDDASSGPNQVALLLSAILAGGIGHFVLKLDYRAIEKHAIKSIVLAMEALIILLIVGGLIGLWILGGIVPAMIVYGINLLNPRVFLLMACLICSVVSLAIGSSWSTMGTMGVALIGVGQALGFPAPLVAGAIISGAYFGDKMSPLSETTNMAPGIAGSNLFIHIRHMFYTTAPAYTLTIAGFTAIGLFYTPGEFSAEQVADVTQTIHNTFHIHWYLMLVPVIVIIMAARQMPPIPALVAGGLLGALTALFVQPQHFLVDGAFSWRAGYMRVIDTAYNGFALHTGNEMVDNLLARGGMLSMFSTITLVLTAMLFGGAMEATGMLSRLAHAILSRVRGAGSLISATVASCILFNIAAAEQYLAIVIPGRMFRSAYAERRLDPRNLSRALEDGGTVTSVLVPWNTCGAFASSVLGVATFAYLPFCLFNWLCPLVSITMASLHLAIKPLDVEPTPEVQPETEVS